MKIACLANLVLQLDSLHKRIDLQRPAAHAVTLMIAVLWAAWGATGTEDLLLRAVAAVLFAGIARLMLSRLGASRLTAVVIIAGMLFMARLYTPVEVMLVCAYAAAMLVVQEYFLAKTKFVAATVTILASLLIAAANGHASAVALLFSSVVIARVLWHATLERLSKRAFVLFAVKGVAMAIIAPAIAYAVNSVYDLPYDLPNDVPSIDLPVWLFIVLGLVCLRGLWATMLLKTDRSPLYRPLRTFYLTYALALYATVALIATYGNDIFVPRVLQEFGTFGIAEFGLVSSAYAIFTIGLLLGAGTDRTLYATTGFARSIQHFLKRN